MENYFKKKSYQTLFNGHCIGLGSNSMGYYASIYAINGAMQFCGMLYIYLYLFILSQHSQKQQ